MQLLDRARAWLSRWVTRWFPHGSPAREARTALTQLQAFQIAQRFISMQESALKQEMGGGAMRAEMLEAEMMSGSGPGMTAREAAQRIDRLDVVVKERLLELELALDNIGWRRQLAYADLEFSRNGIQGIIKISRLYYLKNPLVKRAVEISGSYVYARGFEVRCDEPAAQDTIDEFFELNKNELGHMGMIEKEQTLRTDGNLFILLFPSPTGQTVFRTIDAVEIQDIITDPDDASVPQYYRRVWHRKNFDLATGSYQNEQVETWYPALDYEPHSKPVMIGKFKVEWDQPVLHVKIGGLPKWLFGCPDIYAMLDWARSYKGYLEDWCTMNKAASRFLMDVETKGGNQTIEALQNFFNTTVGSGDDNLRDFVDRNPPSTTASTLIHGPGTKISLLKSAGMIDTPERGRRVGMMAGSASGIPETMLFGDATTGSLATAQSLDRPTELGFLRRQEHCREWMGGRIIPYVLRMSAASPGGQLREAWGDRADHLRVKMVKRKRLENGREVEMWETADQRKNGDVTISVKFPAILEHDVAIMVSAIVQAVTLGGFQPGGSIDMRRAAELLAAEVGIEDVEKMLDAMYPPTDYDEKNYADNGKEDAIEDAPQPPAQSGAHLVAPSFGRESAHLAQAVNALREALRTIQAQRSA